MLQRTCASPDGDGGERATAAMAEVMEVVLLRVSARITKLAQFVRFEGQLMGLNEFLTSQNHMKSRGYRSHYRSVSWRAQRDGPAQWARVRHGTIHAR